MTGAVLEGAGGLADLRGEWDGLPLSRARHADLYDSCSWLESWLAVAPASAAPALRVPCVRRDGRLVGVMPMLETGRGRWTIPALGFRPRYRLPCRGESPEPEVLTELIELAAGRGARELQLVALPTDDPQTALLRAALEENGYRISATTGTTESLCPAETDWEAHARLFREVRKTSNKRRRRAESLGGLRMRAFGGGDGEPIAEGFRLYARIHRRSWKGPLRPATREHRRLLLSACDRLGWTRVFVLELAGRPAAAHIWFRVGGRAISYSTVYDESLATLSLGTVIQWDSHAWAFSGGAPEMIDYLPGRGVLKDRLGKFKPHLQVITARRRTLFGGVAFPLRNAARRTARAARLIGANKRSARPAAAAPAPVLRGRPLSFEGPGRLEVDPLDVAAPVDLWLAVAGRCRSPKEMAREWGEADRWFLVGRRPIAAARVELSGEQALLKELVFSPGPEQQVDLIARSLAGHFSRPLVMIEPAENGPPQPWRTEMHRSTLPWPVGERVSDPQPSRAGRERRPAGLSAGRRGRHRESRAAAESPRPRR